MISTAQRIKVTTTRGWVPMDSVVDGYQVEDVRHDDDGNTSLKLAGQWSEYLPSEWPISYYV